MEKKGTLQELCIPPMQPITAILRQCSRGLNGIKYKKLLNWQSWMKTKNYSQSLCSVPSHSESQVKLNTSLISWTTLDKSINLSIYQLFIYSVGKIICALLQECGINKTNVLKATKCYTNIWQYYLPEIMLSSINLDMLHCNNKL